MPHAAEGTQARSSLPAFIKGCIQRFGDNVDTDSIAPTEICLNPTPEILAHGAFLHSKPNFYDLSQQGATILVAENAFGTGSSREQAPKALSLPASRRSWRKATLSSTGGTRQIMVCWASRYGMRDSTSSPEEGVEMSIDIQRGLLPAGMSSSSFIWTPSRKSCFLQVAY